MSPNVPLFVQVFCIFLSLVSDGVAAFMVDPLHLHPSSAVLYAHFHAHNDSKGSSRGHSSGRASEGPHVDNVFCAPSSGTMTSGHMLMTDPLHDIRRDPSLIGSSGHGNTATTMSPNVPLSVQVGDRKYYFHSDDPYIVVLPCPRTLLCSIFECFSVARLLLGLSGDIEENPGPMTEQMCKEMLQNQKEILSKLSAIQDKHNSFEVQMLDLQKRLCSIESKVQAIDETQSRLGRLETVVSKSSDETLRLANRVDDLDNRSRRNNLIIRGVAEDDQETEEILLRKVNDEIVKSVLEVEVTSIERIHRLGRRLVDRTRPIIFRVADYRDKTRILGRCSRLKGTNYSIGEDFSKKVSEIRKKLWNSAAEERKQGCKIKLVFDKLKVNNALYAWNEESSERYRYSTEPRTANV